MPVVNRYFLTLRRSVVFGQMLHFLTFSHVYIVIFHKPALFSVGLYFRANVSFACIFLFQIRIEKKKFENVIEMFVIFRLTYPIFFILLFNQSVLQRHSAVFHSGSSSMKMSITYKRNEYSCNTHTNIDQVYTCLPIENQQTVSIRCVPIEHMCNGIRDCPNGDDESETNCGSKFPEPILNDASNIQGAVTYYALMAKLCTVMIILILVAFLCIVFGSFVVIPLFEV